MNKKSQQWHWHIHKHNSLKIIFYAKCKRRKLVLWTKGNGDSTSEQNMATKKQELGKNEWLGEL